MLRRLLGLSLLGLSSLSLSGQTRVDPRHRYERVILVVPLVGAGTYADPRRPLFAPAQLTPADRTGILGYSWQPTDDGRLAIVEFVARDRAALTALRTDARVVQAFEKGRARAADVEAALRLLKRDFDLARFGAVIP